MPSALSEKAESEIGETFGGLRLPLRLLLGEGECDLELELLLPGRSWPSLLELTVCNIGLTPLPSSSPSFSDPSTAKRRLVKWAFGGAPLGMELGRAGVVMDGWGPQY